MCRKQVLAQRQVTHRPGVSGHRSSRPGGPQPVQGESVQAALAQQGGQRRGGHLAQPGEYGRRPVLWFTPDAVGGRARIGVGTGHGAGRAEAVVRFDDRAAQPTRRLVPRADLDLHHVAGVHHGRSGGRPCEDDVAGFEGDAGGTGRRRCRRNRSGRLLGRPGVLGQVPVDPGAQADRGQVDGARVDQPRAERGEAVDPLGPHVGAPVGVAQVVDAEVVRGGDPGHVIPAVRPADPAGARPDDQRHLPLEGEQFAAGRPRNRVAAFGQRGGGLEEVRRPGRHRATFGRTAPVADVHRDDLAGNVFQGSHDAKIIYE